jgi:hypothetical protein
VYDDVLTCGYAVGADGHACGKPAVSLDVVSPNGELTHLCDVHARVALRWVHDPRWSDWRLEAVPA